MVALPGQALQYHQDEEDHLQRNIILLTVHKIAVLLIVIWVQSFIPIDRKLRVKAQKNVLLHVMAYRQRANAQNITNIKSSEQWLSLSTSSS